MKGCLYLLIPLLLSCRNNRKENSRYDGVMIFSSDTSYVNDISWEMDNLFEIFYQDSSLFSIDRAKNIKSNQVKEILHDLDHLKVRHYVQKNPYIQEHAFCKKWQIILLKEGVQQCAICIDTNSMLMSIKDSIFKIDRDKFYDAKSLKDFYPREAILDQRHYNGRVIYIQE